MTTEWVLGLGKQTLVLALSIALPMLCVGMALGIIMSIIQTVTSIREQSMMIVVKLVGVMVALIFSLPWIISSLISFITNLYMSLPSLVGK